MRPQNAHIYTEIQALSCEERGLFSSSSLPEKSHHIARPHGIIMRLSWSIILTGELQCRTRHWTRQRGLDLLNRGDLEIHMPRSFAVFSQLPRPSRCRKAALVGPAHVVTSAGHRRALRALPPIRVVEVAELARVAMTATVGRITADGGLMRVCIAPSSGTFRYNRGMLATVIGFGSDQRRDGAGRSSGFGFGRKWPAQMTLGRVGGAINGARIGKRRCVMGIAWVGGGIAGMRVIFVWPVTAVVWLVALRRWHVVRGIRSRFLERLIDFVKYLVSPIADSRAYV